MPALAEASLSRDAIVRILLFVWFKIGSQCGCAGEPICAVGSPEQPAIDFGIRRCALGEAMKEPATTRLTDKQI